MFLIYYTRKESDEKQSNLDGTVSGAFTVAGFDGEYTFTSA